MNEQPSVTRKETRTPEVETTRKGASATRNWAKEVCLIASAGCTGCLGGAGRDLLLFDLEDGRETRGGAIGVYRGSENVTGCRTAT